MEHEIAVAIYPARIFETQIYVGKNNDNISRAPRTQAPNNNMQYTMTVCFTSKLSFPVIGFACKFASSSLRALMRIYKIAECFLITHKQRQKINLLFSG